MKMIVSATGVAFLKEREGFSDRLRRDTTRMMIGYGCNLTPEQAKEYEGRTITREEGHQLMMTFLNPIEQEVGKMITVPVTQNQFDALSSFAFNEGWPSLRNSTLMHKLNAGDVTGAANEFSRWIFAEGVENDGLKARRELEKQLFLT